MVFDAAALAIALAKVGSWRAALQIIGVSLGISTLAGLAVFGALFAAFQLPEIWGAWRKSRGEAAGDASFRAWQFSDSLKTQMYQIDQLMKRGAIEDAAAAGEVAGKTLTEFMAYNREHEEAMKGEQCWELALLTEQIYAEALTDLKNNIEELRQGGGPSANLEALYAWYADAKQSLTDWKATQRALADADRDEKLAVLQGEYDTSKDEIKSAYDEALDDVVSAYRAKETTYAVYLEERRKINTVKRTQLTDLKKNYLMEKTQLKRDTTAKKAEITKQYNESLKRTKNQYYAWKKEIASKGAAPVPGTPTQPGQPTPTPPPAPKPRPYAGKGYRQDIVDDIDNTLKANPTWSYDTSAINTAASGAKYVWVFFQTPQGTIKQTYYLSG